MANVEEIILLSSDDEDTDISRKVRIFSFSKKSTVISIA